jgi:predicted membrane chloride channel (bestrophin family)
MTESTTSGDTVGHHNGLHITTSASSTTKRNEIFAGEEIRSPLSPTAEKMTGSFQRHASFDIDDYFTGPRDMARHSKWPLFMQMHGSILPKMILPLLFIGVWSTAITYVAMRVHPIGIKPVLLTITGFVVGLGLSFRSSTAYERYQDGRRYWTSLITASQALGRVLWIHAGERQDEDPRTTLITKISTMNMVVAFAISLKHTLRFEPYTDYQDLQNLVGHLDTFAKEATANTQPSVAVGKKSFFKEVGEYLGVSFAASNPRKTLKRASKPLGNLPLEILNHIAITVDEMVIEDQLPVPMQQTLAYNNLALLGDALTGCERVLNTPLPIAYSIAISQITWVYVLLLPFQLLTDLKWLTIPATIAASYIILGLLLIGREIENPFGQDVNDLPLDLYCEQIAAEMDIIASFEKRTTQAFMGGDKNVPLYPVSSAPASIWMQRSEKRLRQAIKNKPTVTFGWRQTQMARHEKTVAGESNV